ncbi:WRKY DNA-binding protein 65 [Prunus dulcis]|uniref:WRKY DNA-binding protein 65 n=1 Tax=Prunus dulcis TaxID=3755 RepID=A0A4Y1RAG2_PRUDU|nr:WRKY DNA-binding protein 65 [Prunus dulcis]
MFTARRAIQKRVVSIPIKGDNSNTPPPSDSWAWRKYGQKPIKGSPYPSNLIIKSVTQFEFQPKLQFCRAGLSCKEASREKPRGPSMLVITYSSEHNHPWPASRNHHNHHQSNSSSTAAASAAVNKQTRLQQDRSPEAQQPDHQDHDPTFADLNDESLLTHDEFGWFADMETTSSTVLESPIFTESGCAVWADSADMAAMVFPMGEEDESLFADLGELPECSLVFRHRGVGPQVQIC